MAYDLPSWLQADAPSEPFKALLAGAQVGNEIARTVNSARSQAGALAQRSYEFDVERQRMSELDAVRQKQIDQQLELGRLNIKNHLLADEEKIKADRAISGAAKIFGDHQLAGIAGTDASEARIWSYISNNPEFYIHPGAKDFEAKVGLARQSREKASQFEDQEVLRLAQLEALNARKAAELQSKETIASVRSDAQVEAASIRAEASARSLLNTKEFQTFKARKDSIVNDVRLTLDKKFDEIQKLEEQYNVVRKTDTGATTTEVTPAGDPAPITQEEFDALPSGTWFINPADGKRMKKK